MEGCKQSGLDWVLNPWDDVFHEFHITQCGWGGQENACHDIRHMLNPHLST